MTVGDFASDIIGALFVAAAFAWAVFDATQHQGRVGMSTLIGALVLAAAGGFLVSKRRTLELIEFLFTQAGRARGLK